MIDRSEPSPPQPDPDAARVNGESSPCASLAAGDHIELAPTTCTCRVAPSEQSCAAIRCRWAAPGSENRLAVRRPPTAPLRAFRAGRSDPRRHHECSPMTGPAAVTPFKQTLGPGAAHNAPARALSKQAESRTIKPHTEREMGPCPHLPVTRIRAATCQNQVHEYNHHKLHTGIDGTSPIERSPSTTSLARTARLAG